MSGQDRLLEGDFSEARTEEELNAPIEWRGLPEFRPVTRDVRLVLSFDAESDRDQLVDQLGLVISKKTGPTWSAWWPPRDREDLASLRFDFGPDGEASLPEEPEPDELGGRPPSQPSPDEEDVDDGPGVEPADEPETAAIAAYGTESGQEPRSDRERFGAYPGQEPYSR